jgi:putative endonuclease
MFSWFKRILAWFSRRAATRGETGEALAAEFLRRERGFAVVVRNWRSPRDRRAELDLVCRDGAVLVFVEVKTRTTGALVPGYYAINRRKKRALLRACQAYLALLAVRPRTYRLDVVEVELPAASAPGSAAPALHHFENVPLFSRHDRG